MIIALCLLIVNVIIPRVLSVVHQLTEPVIVGIIMIAAILIMLSAVGVKISQNLGSTVLKGILGGLGRLGTAIIHGIGWLIRQIARLLPRVYHGSQRWLTQIGMKPGFATVLAVLITVIVLIVII